jgi:hypothetical protein
MSSSVQTRVHSEDEIRFIHDLALSLSNSYRAFQEFCATLKRDYVFCGGKPLPAIELASWLTFVEEKAFPLNTHTANLIEANRNLWPTLPEGIADFMDYHSTWVSLHEAWKQDPTVPYSYTAGRNFPQTLNLWVLVQARDLMRRYAEGSAETVCEFPTPYGGTMQGRFFQ